MPTSQYCVTWILRVVKDKLRNLLINSEASVFLVGASYVISQHKIKNRQLKLTSHYYLGFRFSNSAVLRILFKNWICIKNRTDYHI